MRPVTEAHGPIHGTLHWVQPRRIRGWAYVPARPSEHARIDVYLDGVLVAATAASMPSEKLAARGVGQGDHAFLATPSVPLPMTEWHRVAVVATGALGERLELKISPAQPLQTGAAPA
jgi:hypothetical protein